MKLIINELRYGEDEEEWSLNAPTLLEGLRRIFFECADTYIENTKLEDVLNSAKDSRELYYNFPDEVIEEMKTHWDNEDFWLKLLKAGKYFDTADVVITSIYDATHKEYIYEAEVYD